MIDWNILTGDNIKSIASAAPTTVPDLDALGILGEKKLEEYGSRIVKAINKYVEDEGLEGCLVQRPAKRPKVASSKDDGNPVDSDVIEINE